MNNGEDNTNESMNNNNTNEFNNSSNDISIPIVENTKIVARDDAKKEDRK